MWDEYELTYSVALTMKNEELTNLASIKKNISSLKGEIRDLGDVNVNSIEEYKSVSERYTFLKTQHDDLVIAAENLEKIIEELDTGMRNQFTEKFTEIRVEFDKVFKEHFGGGKGTIELNEDIYVNPGDTFSVVFTLSPVDALTDASISTGPNLLLIFPPADEFHSVLYSVLSYVSFEPLFPTDTL